MNVVYKTTLDMSLMNVAIFSWLWGGKVPLYIVSRILIVNY